MQDDPTPPLARWVDGLDTRKETTSGERGFKLSENASSGSDILGMSVTVVEGREVAEAQHFGMPGLGLDTLFPRHVEHQDIFVHFAARDYI
jgi:hypothetical protein